MSDIDYYELLGIGPEAELEEIDLAYQRALTNLLHQLEPGADLEQARRLVEAGSVLIDPAARAKYDARRVGQDLIDETVAAIFEQLHVRAARKPPQDE